MANNEDIYGVLPDQPWPRTDGDLLISGDTTPIWGAVLVGGNISSRERETAKALQDCAIDLNGAPMVCSGCRNTAVIDSFPSEPNINCDDCSKCYRNQHAPSISPNTDFEDLYITQYTEDRLAHKFATETLPKVRAQMRIEIAKELSEEKSESNRIINRNILSKTIKRNNPND